MSIQENQQEDADEFYDMLNIHIKPDQTPEEKFFDELTEGRYPKISNALYWLKHELFVYTFLQDKMYIVTKPSKDGRIQLSTKELARAFLQYYFDMIYLPRFETDRPERKHLMVNQEKFLDMILDYPLIKKTIEDPRKFV